MLASAVAHLCQSLRRGAGKTGRRVHLVATTAGARRRTSPRAGIAIEAVVDTRQRAACARSTLGASSRRRGRERAQAASASAALPSATRAAPHSSSTATCSPSPMAGTRRCTSPATWRPTRLERGSKCVRAGHAASRHERRRRRRRDTSTLASVSPMARGSVPKRRATLGFAAQTPTLPAVEPTKGHRTRAALAGPGRARAKALSTCRTT